MTWDQIIALTSLIVTGIWGFVSLRWSNMYTASKKAELDAKDAVLSLKDSELESKLTSKDEQSKSIEEKYQAIVSSKDEQIKVLEMVSSPLILERYNQTIRALEEINDESKKELNIFQKAYDRLKQQVDQASSSNEAFKESIPGLAMPSESRSALDVFVTGSANVIKEIGQSTRGLLVVGENLEKNTEEISNVTSLVINPTPTESVTFADIAKVEITGPDSDEAVDDNNNDDQPSDPEDVIPENMC